MPYIQSARGPQNYGDVITQLSDLQSSTEGISSLEDLRRRYGMKDTGSLFGAARRNLGTQRAQALSSAATRMGTSSANPEAMFAPIEGQFAGAFGELEGQEAQAGQQQQNFLTQLLQDILTRRDQFGLQKIGMQGSILDRGIQQKFLESQAPGMWDDIIAILSLASQTAGGAAMAGAAASSRDFKKEIVLLTDEDHRKNLEKVRNLNIVRYRYKEEPRDEPHIGLIAEDAPKEFLAEGGKAVNVYDFVSTVASAVKALGEEIDGLKRR